MSEDTNNDTQQPSTGEQISGGIERVWSEIKLISRQFEQETRRTGRAARLKLDLRRLQKEQEEVRARLGTAVFAASLAHGDDISLNAVEGFAGGVAALNIAAANIAAKEAELEALKGSEAAAETTPAPSEEVAGEAVSG
jgi:hypothetical protein